MDVVATLGALFVTIISSPHNKFTGPCPPKGRHQRFQVNPPKGTNG
jgi:hypothetical protein